MLTYKYYCRIFENYCESVVVEGPGNVVIGQQTVHKDHTVTSGENVKLHDPKSKVIELGFNQTTGYMLFIANKWQCVTDDEYNHLVCMAMMKNGVDLRYPARKYPPTYSQEYLENYIKTFEQELIQKYQSAQ